MRQPDKKKLYTPKNYINTVYMSNYTEITI
jgi:hypothetical protein